MANLQRVALYPNERSDTPDARAVEAFSENDWRYYLSGVMADSNYVLTGFDIANYSTIFTSPGFKLKLNNTVIFYPSDSSQASGFYVSAGTEADESVTLSPSSTNYVEASLSVFSSTPDVRAFWDSAANAGAGGEYTDTVDTVINLKLDVAANISGFTTGRLPLYKVVTNINGIVTSVTDCRPLFFRLGTGGSSPNPGANFTFPSLPDPTHARLETPITATSYSSTNAPWQGGDKNIKNEKAWKDAVMTILKEVRGVPFWYMLGSGGSIPSAYQNAASIILSGGSWQHDPLNLGYLKLLGGSIIKRLGFVNSPTLSAFASINLNILPTLYVLLPTSDTAVVYGFGADAATPISPKAVGSFTATSITVPVGGNYPLGPGKILAGGIEFTYTSYTPGTGLFNGVSPSPSGLLTGGETVYAVDFSGVGYYHYSSVADVPGVTGGVSEGAERVLWLAYYDGASTIILKSGDLQLGEEIQIGETISVNLLNYIGTPGDNINNPTYGSDAGGAKVGETNYNVTSTEDLTVRASKLTSMMFDKAQDKEIVFAQSGIANIINTINGINQDITFTGAAQKLNIKTPQSLSGFVGLTGTLSLAQNQAAYYSIDRNIAFSVANLAGLSVANIASVPIDENTFIFAYRLTGNEIYLWDNTRIGVGIYPANQILSENIRTTLGVIDEDSKEAYSSTNIVQPTDSYPTAISRLDSDVYDLLNETPLEEYQIVPFGGATLFNATTITWSPLNTIWDILVFVNDRYQTQDTAGGLSEDYRKNSDSQIEFSYTLQEDDRVTVIVLRPLFYLGVTPFFRKDNLATGGVAAFVGAKYNMGTSRLTVFRNSTIINNAALGGLIDQYIESSQNSITLGLPAPPPEVLSYINLPVAPSYRIFNTGLIGPALTVPPYTMGTNQFLLFRGGILMNAAALGGPIDQYTETNPTTITLASPAVPTELFAYLSLAVPPSYRQDFTGIVGPTLTVLPYTMGNGRLLVFRNGALMFNSLTLGSAIDQYQETNPTTLTLQSAAVATDVFSVINL